VSSLHVDVRGEGLLQMHVSARLSPLAGIVPQVHHSRLITKEPLNKHNNQCAEQSGAAGAGAING
jgi:hypothetical protein